MNGFKAYQTYIAIKNHFYSSYDYFKYQGKTNVDVNSFNKRKDKFFFEKIEKKHKKDLTPFFVSNLIENQDSWAGSLVNEQSEKIYLKWKRKFESLKYEFKQELSTIKNHIDENNLLFDDLFKYKENEHPILFKFLLSSTISIETFIILDKILNFITRFDKIMVDDFIWKEYNIKIRKYSMFIDIDNKEYKKILRDIFL